MRSEWGDGFLAACDVGKVIRRVGVCIRIANWWASGTPSASSGGCGVCPRFRGGD